MSEHDKDFLTVAKIKFAAAQRVVGAWSEDYLQPLLKKLAVSFVFIVSIFLLVSQFILIVIASI